jgi:transcription initiation factor TFIIIB Brf1 subunit/transcription initiation factor TFIIB
LVHLSANAFTKKDILKLEADIVNELNFNLIMDNTLKFMQPFVKIIKMSYKNMHLTQYILELALLDMTFLSFKPSLLAASAIYLVNKIRKVD